MGFTNLDTEVDIVIAHLCDIDPHKAVFKPEQKVIPGLNEP